MAGMSFHDYMRSYANDHQHPVNKAIHMVCVPAIVASLPLLVIKPRLGAKIFAAGWAAQFVGHYLEGKKPSFASDLRYLAVGPIWAAVEWVHVLTGLKIYETRPAPTEAETAHTAATPAAHEAPAPDVTIN